MLAPIIKYLAQGEYNPLEANCVYYNDSSVKASMDLGPLMAILAGAASLV